jgi:hypothetical protein
MNSVALDFRRLLGRGRIALSAGIVALLAACSHENANPLVSDAAITYDTTTAKRRAVIQPKTKRPLVSERRLVVRLKPQTRQLAYGRGPYICSPSGFGRNSHCVPRTSF